MFVAGDRVLVHYDDGQTEFGIVRNVMNGEAEVRFEPGREGQFPIDQLWLTI